MAIVGPGLLAQAQVPEGDRLPAGRGIMNNEQLIIIMHKEQLMIIMHKDNEKSIVFFPDQT